MLQHAPSYVIGHKNPDADAICSAIAYANFLQHTTMPGIIAARCGEVGIRTAYVLGKAGIDHPQLVMDVRPNTARVCRRDVVHTTIHESFMEAFNRMRESRHRTIPVLDDDRKVVGMTSLMKLMDYLLPEGQSLDHSRIVETNLKRMSYVLGGSIQNEVDVLREQEFVVTIAALSAEGFKERLSEMNTKALIVIVGDRPTVQSEAIRAGVRALVLTGNNHLSPELLEQALQGQVAVLVSPHDTATTALLVRCSRPIAQAMNVDYLAFEEKELLRNIKDKVLNSGEILFPVIDEHGSIAGVFSKSDLVEPPRARLVLVDHNEFSQAVTGVEDADIIEVIDHHKLGGGLASREPIRFLNEPLGSTSTIVARMFRQHGFQPERPVALCMAAGIISDTLFLTSPTTTSVDKDMIEWLEPFAGCSLRQFADEFFATGSALQLSAAPEVVTGDCKEYGENGWKIAVAQVEEQGLDHFWSRKKELRAALESMNQSKGLDFSCLLITNIVTHYSILLAVGHEDILKTIDYPKLDEGLYELEGIVSRKKQLLPHLVWALNKVSKE